VPGFLFFDTPERSTGSRHRGLEVDGSGVALADAGSPQFCMAVATPDHRGLS